MRTAINLVYVFILVHRIKNMSGFGDFFLHQEYTKTAGFGNPLDEIREYHNNMMIQIPISMKAPGAPYPEKLVRNHRRNSSYTD